MPNPTTPDPRPQPQPERPREQPPEDQELPSAPESGRVVVPDGMVRRGVDEFTIPSDTFGTDAFVIGQIPKISKR